MNFGEESEDNVVFTCTSLSAGCGIGVIFGIAILLAFSVTTYAPTLVTDPTWVTPTPTNLTENTSWEPEPVYENKYAGGGIAVLAIGILACPTILLAITVLRRLKDSDLLRSDALGIGIVVLGFLCGVAVGIGSFFAFGWETRGYTELGVFLFILVPFAAIVTVLLLLCYRHHKENDGGFGFGRF
jgi:hypothetical protein